MSQPKLTIVKIGGNVIDNSEKLHYFLKDFADLPGAKILVHGGGKTATDLSTSMGISPQMIEGRRITDIDTLRVVTMVYAGLINKNLVAQLQNKGCNAIGLTGADGNMIRTVKRPVQNRIDFGLVGDIVAGSVNEPALTRLLDAGFIPVQCAITHDGDGQLLNTNADTIASAIAVAMSAHYSTDLVYCFEKKGVMLDIEDESSRIQQIDQKAFETLRAEGTVSAGMLPKISNALDAVINGVAAVYIGKAEELSAYTKGEDFGTKIIL